ncbi:outer membrane beta-barrel protein [Afipia felis]|uniref:Uncharacterized protein conserved in bacteria n=2 Tax=Afipia felis TaxID=1035 RepID=A0A380W673_AFIFE|nr:hypothetical protein HMPREF9697_00164 [Afipia felis ATCC 53690]SUU76345.1 Uncharacterized protein conserved in bacteria [Afipia felis]SUU84412.1 Uncharacterized protein conserved in bacteria [Afipia felis]
MLRTALLCGSMIMAAFHPAWAEDEFVASLRLRGGYDSNPQFSNGSGIGGSAFIGTDASMAAAHKDGDASLGIAAEASQIQYANPQATPALNGKVIIRGMLGSDDLNVSSVTTISDISTYNLRSSDLIQSVKGEAKIGSFKLFATAEGARSSLNQTNAIFQDFLPEAQQYLRGTLIPGVAYACGKFEVGASVNLSMRRYAQEFDVFGYRRDNERIQPFVFAKYADKDFSVTGSLSQLRGTWHDPDFSNVKALLYEGHLHWRHDAWTLDLTAWKRANETTFPISPITIDAAYTGKLSWAATPQLTLSAAAGYTTTRYLESPFDAQTATVAFGGSYDLGNDYALGLDLTYAHGVLISGDKASALILSSSITKKFSPFAKAAVEKDKNPNRKI